MDTIKKRRSIRKYKPIKISEDIIRDIIMAGMSAPSAHDEQPWRFIIVDDRKIMDAIPKFHPFAIPLLTAMQVIVVCADTVNLRTEGRWMLDCSACTENMLLEIEYKGLGGVWIGLYPDEERVQKMRDLLNIPQNIMPFSIVCFGVKDEFKNPHSKYREDIVFRNTWAQDA